MKHNYHRPAYLERRRRVRAALGALTHPAAPGPDESDDDKRRTATRGNGGAKHGGKRPW